MRRQLITLLALATLSSCKSREYQLKDLIDVQTIDSVTIHNNSGDYRLNPVELRAFKNTLGAMNYRPRLGVKMGNIGLGIFLKGKSYYAEAETHDHWIRMHRSIIDQNSRFLPPIFNPAESEELVFEFDETINLDNFQK